MEQQDKTSGGFNPAYALAKKLQENKSSLHIARIPKATRETFVAIADEEFCSDYGMLLKYLIDKAMDVDSKNILMELNRHEERLNALEQSSNDDNNHPKMLNGRHIKREVKT